MSIQANFPALKPTLLLDFANVKQLDPRITFTRASEGRYYDGKTFSKAEENLLTYSQEFDNAAWLVSAVTVTANTTAAPDGTTTADTITFGGGGASCRIDRTVTASALDTTRSVFVRAGTASFVQFLSAGDTTAFANFDVSAGTVGTVGSGVTASIVNAGGGWYRIIMTFAKAGATQFRIQGIDSSTAAYGATMTTGGTVFLWGAQLEQRSSVTAYTATTTQPITNYIPQLMTAANGVARFDHNPVTEESLGLLIEEQRTNLLTYSEQFDNAAWGKTRTSITANTIVAPDGALTGDKLVEDTSASTTHLIAQSASYTSGTTYVFSVYAKAAERTSLRIRASTQATWPGEATFDLSTGTITATANGTATITNVGNGWYRCSVAAAASATGATGTGVWLVSGGNINYTGDGYSGIYIWGAQLEAGAFPTSYIPTVAAQVTRSADAASMTGTNFSSWYRPDEGTVYWDGSGVDAFSRTMLSISDNTANNRIRMVWTTSNARSISTEVTTGNTFQGSVPSAISTITNGQQYRLSFGYKTNDLAGSRDGGVAGTDTSALIPVVDRMYIGAGPTGAFEFFCGHIRKIAFYPARVTNAQLAALTS